MGTLAAVSMDFRSAEQRWAAVTARASAADGAFYYGVRTTGVFCRPSCASRRPNRDNVAFFDSIREAVQAGFRACRKCRPDADALGQDVVVQACRRIEQAERPTAVAELAAAAGLSASRFRRLFKQVTGVTPRAYAATTRSGRLQARLLGGATATAALYDAGFGASSRCYETAAATLGMTPARYGKGGLGADIRFAIAPCRLGYVLVAATERGICAIQLGDGPEELRQGLVSRFPAACRADETPDFAELLARVVALVDAPSRGHDLPLDIQGTVFQRLVWQALQQIPAGSTATYEAVARRIGRPRAARAVARACAANPVAVAVPCHRVVRGDGAMGGYRWGTSRKRDLLRLESASPPTES